MYLFLFTASSSILTSVKENLGLAFSAPFTPPVFNSSSSSRHGADMAAPPPPLLLTAQYNSVWHWVQFHLPPGSSRPDSPASLDHRHLQRACKKGKREGSRWTLGRKECMNRLINFKSTEIRALFMKCTIYILIFTQQEFYENKLIL